MAAKTPVKLVFPMLLFIFPAIVVVILGPAMIQVMANVEQGRVNQETSREDRGRVQVQP